MTYNVATAMTNLRTMLKGISGMAEAPATVPESMVQFPFGLVFLVSFSTEPTVVTPEWDEIDDLVRVEIHVARSNLPTAFDKAVPFRDAFLTALRSNPTLSGAVQAISTVSGRFGYLEYAKETHLGWQIDLTLHGVI